MHDAIAWRMQDSRGKKIKGAEGKHGRYICNRSGYTKLDSKSRLLAIECGGVFHLSDSHGKCIHEVKTLDGVEVSTGRQSITANVEGILAAYTEYHTMTFYYGSRNGKPVGSEAGYLRSVCS